MKRSGMPFVVILKKGKSRKSFVFISFEKKFLRYEIVA